MKLAPALSILSIDALTMNVFDIVFQNMSINGLKFYRWSIDERFHSMFWFGFDYTHMLNNMK